jgi:hypothetical protein
MDSLLRLAGRCISEGSQRISSVGAHASAVEGVTKIDTEEAVRALRYHLDPMSPRSGTGEVEATPPDDKISPASLRAVKQISSAQGAGGLARHQIRGVVVSLAEDLDNAAQHSVLVAEGMELVDCPSGPQPLSVEGRELVDCNSQVLSEGREPGAGNTAEEMVLLCADWACGDSRECHRCRSGNHGLRSATHQRQENGRRIP